MRLLAFCVLCFLSTPSFAASGTVASDDAVTARLISAADTTGTAATVSLGLELTLANGWHTYWRSPGEAGLPPQLDWSASQNDTGNIKSATLLYPAPTRYEAYGLETVGYRGHVVFPIDVTVLTPGAPLHAAGRHRSTRLQFHLRAQTFRPDARPAGWQ